MKKNIAQTENKATLPTDRMTVGSQKFLQDFNKNKVKQDFLDSCRKAGKLFGYD